MTPLFVRILLSRPAAMFYAMAAPVWCASLGRPSVPGALVEVLGPLVLGGSVALWIAVDSSRRQHTLPCDFAFVACFTWPVFAPVYLLTTRGWRAVFPLAGFAGLFVAATLIGNVPSVIRVWHR